MRIRKLRNFKQLEEELDRRGFDKYGIEPPLGIMVTPDLLFDLETIDDEEDDEL